MTEPRAASALVSFDLVDYARPADGDELAALHGLGGPVLDVGCGPGRLVAALAERGVPALGIDLAPLALDLADARGAPALAHSVFEAVPGEGRWPVVLLFDGNIGIGGDPVDLLRRVGELLAPDGVVVVELDGPGVNRRRSTACIGLATGVTGWLPWARLGIDDVVPVASQSGLEVCRIARSGARWFGRLRRPPASK